MSTQTIINETYAQLYYHEDTGIIHHHITPTTTGTEWRTLLTTGMEAMKQHKAIKWLSDNYDMQTPIPDEDTAWINTVWIENTLAIGWRYWAIVVPESWLARNSMVDFVQAFYDKGLRIMVFTNCNEAITWLENVDK